jgi:hypothetical protein
MSLVSVGFATTWGLAWTAVLICLLGVGALVQGVLLIRKRELSDGGRLVLLLGGLCLFFVAAWSGLMLAARTSVPRNAPPPIAPVRTAQPAFGTLQTMGPRLEPRVPPEIPGEHSDSGIKD